ncbi:MAG TPA: type I methionyl aminopeptidase [Oscillospiraceae bacterium]|jgi:methionyl aminopeptidase|nr:pepM [Oscillospiraceae bacterium]MDN5377955.1 methionyl aminopeptidase [Clostridiales bacterium]HOV40302.1 type I methionyl aminopeptidase [Oscillospiraceae bacterium]
MIIIKSPSEIEKMRLAGKITAGALKVAGEKIRAGMTTKELDRIIHDYIVSQGAQPSFLGYGGFPASACISVNNEVIHGIPGSRKIMDGDIVSVDVGAFINGYHGDSCKTFAVGQISSEARALLDATEESLYIGIKAARPGARVGDISAAIEGYILSKGFAVVKQYVGHGVGRGLHEDPEVPNYGKAGHGPKLVPGMTIAVEPMVNIVGEEVKVMPNKWTVVTKSGSLSAHFEHTIAITSDGAEILTLP